MDCRSNFLESVKSMGVTFMVLNHFSRNFFHRLIHPLHPFTDVFVPFAKKVSRFPARGGIFVSQINPRHENNITYPSRSPGTCYHSASTCHPPHPGTFGKINQVQHI